MAHLYAYCGLDCSECPAYKTTQAKDKKELEALLEEWNSPDYPLTVENLACDACFALRVQVIIEAVTAMVLADLINSN